MQTKRTEKNFVYLPAAAEKKTSFFAYTETVGASSVYLKPLMNARPVIRLLFLWCTQRGEIRMERVEKGLHRRDAWMW